MQRSSSNRSLHDKQQETAANPGQTLILLEQLLADRRTYHALEPSTQLNTDLGGALLGHEGALSENLRKKRAKLLSRPHDKTIWRMSGQGGRRPVGYKLMSECLCYLTMEYCHPGQGIGVGINPKMCGEVNVAIIALFSTANYSEQEIRRLQVRTLKSTKVISGYNYNPVGVGKENLKKVNKRDMKRREDIDAAAAGNPTKAIKRTARVALQPVDTNANKRQVIDDGESSDDGMSPNKPSPHSSNDDDTSESEEVDFTTSTRSTNSPPNVSTKSLSKPTTTDDELEESDNEENDEVTHSLSRSPTLSLFLSLSFSPSLFLSPSLSLSLGLPGGGAPL
jgi:hypothetical protein